MELTGKCELDFDKWLKENNKDLLKLSDPSIYFSEIFSMSALFKYLTESMQYGVYVDFFDGVGISVNNKRVDFNDQTWFCVIVNNNYIEIKNDLPINHFKTRPEARTAAIEKANELYNL